MPEAGEVGSNLKRVTTSYDDELPTPDAILVRDEREGTTQTIEAEAELFEENYRMAHARRWKGQERWMGRENEAMRLVNILHPHEVMHKLQAAGVHASIDCVAVREWGVDDQTGLSVPQWKARSNARLWLNDFVVYLKGTSETNAGRVGVCVWQRDDFGRPVPRCITSLQWDCGPEWSVMHFDEMDVPTCEKYRGWRTALLQLITNGILTEAEVDKAFGPVVENDASLLYRQTLQAYRERAR